MAVVTDISPKAKKALIEKGIRHEFGYGEVYHFRGLSLPSTSSVDIAPAFMLGGTKFKVVGERLILDSEQDIVFLGGTCGDNHWREEIVIPGLVQRGIDPSRLFNPVVEHWDEEAQKREDETKRSAHYMLYVIASPDPQHAEINNVSAYSLVELVMALYDAPDRTVALFDTTGMAGHVVKAINKSVKDLQARFPQAPVFTDYTELVDWLAERL